MDWERDWANGGGWVPNDEWETAKASNQELFGDFIETMAEERTRRETMRMWPFLDAGYEMARRRNRSSYGGHY